MSTMLQRDIGCAWEWLLPWEAVKLKGAAWWDMEAGLGVYDEIKRGDGGVQEVHKKGDKLGVEMHVNRTEGKGEGVTGERREGADW